MKRGHELEREVSNKERVGKKAKKDGNDVNRTNV